MKVKEESEKVGLKLNIQKTKIMASSPTTSWQIDGEMMETVTDFIILGSKITADGDCSHEIKTLAPWKKSYDRPRQNIKKQRHYFTNKGPTSQSYGFSSSQVWMWELDHKESEVAQSCPTLSDPMDCSLPGSSAHGIFQARVLEWDTIAFSKESWVPKNWCFRTVVLEETLESPFDCRSNQSILKEINSEYSLEGLMPKLKLQYFGNLVGRADFLEKTMMLGKIEARRRGRLRLGWLDGITDWFNGHEFEQAAANSEGQGSLVCCNLWGLKESNMT